ncbi:hypothetical protein D3C78_1130910 [compost metagenome]
MDNHPESEIGESAPRMFTRLANDDFGKTLLSDQCRLQVFEHQRQKAQGDIQARPQGRLGHCRTTQKSQTAIGQTTLVHGEELIVAAPRQQPPQPCIGVRGNPCLGQLELFRIDTGTQQHTGIGQSRWTGLQQRFAHKLHGNRVFLAHRPSSARLLGAGHLRPTGEECQRCINAVRPDSGTPGSAAAHDAVANNRSCAG